MTTDAPERCDLSLSGEGLKQTGKVDYEAHQEPATFPIFTTAKPVTVTLESGYTNGEVLSGFDENGDPFAVSEVISVFVDELEYDETTGQYSTVKESVVEFDGSFAVETEDSTIKEDAGTLKDLRDGKVTLGENEMTYIYEGAKATISEPGIYHVQSWRMSMGPCQAYVQILADDSSSAPAGFADVEAGAYYADAVKWAVEEEITNGTSTTKFSPDKNCTQVQILTFLWRAADEPDSSGKLPVDIAGKGLDYADTALRWAYEKGMIDESFDLTAECTRSVAVSYIWQAFKSHKAKKASSFTDVSADADYAGAVSWALENGITNGTSTTTFGPDKVCTRGQIVTFLHRAYVEDVRLK